MNLYDSIKSPFENADTLTRIIDIYSNMEESDNDLYSKLIVDTETQSFDRQKYIGEYEELIRKPTLAELYSNLFLQANKDEELWGILQSVWQKVFQECSSYTELQEKINPIINDEGLRNTLAGIGNGVNDLDNIIEELDEENFFMPPVYEKVADALEHFSSEELKQIAPYVVIYDKMTRHLDTVNTGSMGFHVNAEKIMHPTRKNEENEIKFYINAGDDTCKIASLFRERCKEQNLNYYFKVANPYENEEDRTDKLCIYSSLNDAQKYFEILQEIKKENPQISFGEPPILTGRVDKWLGVASDYKGDRKNQRDTYNSKMSDIVVKAIDKTLKGVNRKDIPEMIRNNSYLMELIKKEVVSMSSKIGYSKEKNAIRKSDKIKLSKSSKISLFDKIKSIFSKRKQLPIPQSEQKKPRNNNDFLERIKVSKSEFLPERTVGKENPSIQKEFPTKPDGQDR